jgi:hypothetical protein
LAFFAANCSANDNPAFGAGGAEPPGAGGGGGPGGGGGGGPIFLITLKNVETNKWINVASFGINLSKLYSYIRLPGAGPRAAGAGDELCNPADHFLLGGTFGISSSS